ncbi:MAG: methyltransferase domain-containing protein [Rhodospirillaceae bacterium]|nr:methyltransferase domain-containing protein [Rhodospirillaceae bacterium]
MSNIGKSRSTWSRGDIEQYLAKEKLDYQKISLPYGLETPGYDRSSTADLIFDESLAGKSVLDVGSSLGYFCFEAERRGANDVVGIEVHADTVRKARTLAEILGSSAKFIEKDLELTTLDRKFDYVLCLNVLHHMHDPIAGLNRLIELTKEKLILEVATFGSHDGKKVNLSGIVCNWLSRFPIMFVAPTGTHKGRSVQRFYMSERAIRNLLWFHRGVFARLEFKKSPHKDRFVVIAHRRRIGHLLVVAGPTSSGKKTLERALFENRVPQVRELLGTPDTAVWAPAMNLHHLEEPGEPVRERLLLHYDITRPLMRSTRVYERDKVGDVISCAQRVTVLTIKAGAERLRAQIGAAAIDNKTHRGKKPKQRHLRIRDFYGDPAKVDAMYRAWLDFVSRHTQEHWLVEAVADGYRVSPAGAYQAG